MRDIDRVATNALRAAARRKQTMADREHSKPCSSAISNRGAGVSDRMRLGLELLYVALENLIVVVADDDGDNDNHRASLAWLLVLATDMQGAITEYWQGLDVAVVDELELRG